MLIFNYLLEHHTGNLNLFSPWIGSGAAFKTVRYGLVDPDTYSECQMQVFFIFFLMKC
jgi:hypothetical protein